MKFLTGISRFLVASAVFASFMTLSAFASNLGKVTGDNVNLRSYNSTAGQLVSVAKKNDVLTIVANANNGWFEITTSNKKKAFISADYLQIVQTDATCIADDVNVRSYPSTSSESLGKAKNKLVLVTTGVTGDWYQVKFNGKTGYIHSQFMQGSLLKYLQPVTVAEPTSTTTDNAAMPTSTGQVAVVSTPASNQKTSGAYATVTAESLNLRDSASMTANVIKSLPKGYNLNILATEGEWVKVSDDSGAKGYVFGTYIEFKNGTKPENSTSKTNIVTTKVSVSGSVDIDELIDYSKQFIGTPYVYGGTSLTSGVDCSGFVMSVYKNFGVTLKRTSRDMFTQGTPVEKANLQPGDLLFFNTGGSSIISHVGMYIGNDEYIHSTNGAGDGVTISSLNDSYAKKTYVGARRILD